MRILIGLLWMIAVTCPLSAADPRKTTSLDGEWKFRRDDQKEWKSVTVPAHWETHEGLKFDGVGWYEKTLPAITLPPGRRLLLHFDAVATQTTVYCDDRKLGEHLGAWTPFRFEITDHVKKPGPHTIRVRVDEKVGHNTQGFLPIIAPHFGGIWQGVKLIEVPETYIDDLDVVLQKRAIRFPVKGNQPVSSVDVTMETYNPSTREGEVIARGSGVPANQPLVHEGYIELEQDWQPKERGWSPTTPTTWRVTFKLSTGDVVSTTTGFRSIETKGDQFLLNGRPLSIRGVLNWGYYPPSLAPTPTDEQWRSDLRLIKSWGFNLMKCCLWVPPERLLDIADEEGILLWIEYPTWHPKLTPQYRDELMREYREFHQLDRNHPSVILRSLTCETGPGADLKVIRALFDQCKQMCGGLVEDDSSWIEWNRITDFYDDHPYGNNHTWVATLARLKNFIAHSKLGVKPLCLGEAIAADTWVPTQPLLDAIAKAKADPTQAWSLDDRGYPFWIPGFFDANRKWLERMAKVCGGPIDEKALVADSLRYASLMRKYQMKAYQKEVPNGGYVVSVIRDFPTASMGLLDYLGKPKWSETDWTWHHPEAKPAATQGWPPALFRTDPGSHNVRQVHILDAETLDYLQNGGKVLLEPNGQPGSFPLRAHWFLRGAPFVNRRHPLIQSVKDFDDFFVRYQHFDLAGDVIPDVNYLDEIDPIVMLWDNHDLKEVRTHGLLFETRVGQGRLLVSALNCSGETNRLGRWLRERLLKHLESGPAPRNGLRPETITRIRAKLNEKKLDLTARPWLFQPDGKNEGLALGWQKFGFDDRGWKPIRIGSHWEGQGYPALDGWAWYRLKVDVPKDWPTKGMYVNTEGVDDAYELYVNGTKIGEGGDIPNKKTAFEERASHHVPAGLLKPGQANVIAVRVYDWYGAGGIHRPVTLTNIPFGGADLLR